MKKVKIKEYERLFYGDEVGFIEFYKQASKPGSKEDYSIVVQLDCGTTRTFARKNFKKLVKKLVKLGYTK